MANPRDVELIVRARTEGDKALKALTAGLHDLVGVQGDLGKTAGKVDNVLSRLGAEFANLSSEVQGLTQLGKVVNQLDKAAVALTRLEDRVAKTTDELGRLQSAQAAAAASTMKAKAAADAAAQSYEQQQAKAAAVRKEAGRSSEAYQQQATALDAAKAAREQANAGLRTAEAEEKKVKKALAEVSSELSDQSADLIKAHAEWDGLYQASQQASRAMGGIAASQDEVAAAADRAAQKLAATKGAMDFEREAAAGRKLREAAEYVDFWTTALVHKEAVEQKAAAQHSADLFAGAQQDAKQAAAAMDSYQANLNQTLGVQEKFGRSAKDSFDVFAEAGRTEDQMSAASARLRAQIDPLGTIQAHLNAELAKARDLYRSGYITATELAQAEKQLAVNADAAAQAIGRSNSRGGTGTFMGLKPYELHSLSYQINDVFTQLGSGTPIMQVLAQQGGQVFQVFQRQLIPALARLGPTLAAAAPEIAILVAALVAVIAALKNLADQASSVKQFSAQLAASADGATYNAKAMAEAAHQLDVYAGSLDDARKSLSEFTKVGIKPELLERFGRAAQNVATITGKDVATAAKAMAEGFSGGYDAIKKLDDEFNFLTASERENVKLLFESGRAAEARTQAFAAFNKKMEAGAQILRGPVAGAIHNLAVAWDNFITFIGNSKPIQATVDVLVKLARVIKDISDYLPGANDGKSLVDLQARRDNLQSTLNRMQSSPSGSSQAKIDEYKKAIADLDVLIAKEKDLGAAAGTATDTITADSQAQQKARQEVLDAIEKERKGLGDLTDARKVQLAGEEAYQKAIKETGDEAIAQAQKRLAIDKEIEKQRQAINFGSLSGKIAGIESSGDPSAKNPKSTATGLGQFIESTWIKLFKQHFPTEASDLTRDQILDLRKNADISKKMIELYARENAEVLQKAGVATNEAAVYLAHFLGPQGAVKILKAASDTPVDQLLSPKAISSNRSILEGKTAGQVKSFAEGKVGASDSQRSTLAAEAEAAESLRKSAEARKKAQEGFNDAVADENTKRQQSTDAATRLNGLTGEALIQEQRRIAIEQAVAAAEERAKEASEAELRAGREAITLTAEQRAEIEKKAAAEFDASNQANVLAAQRKDIEDPVNDLLERRQLLLQQIMDAQAAGNTSLAATLQSDLTSVDDMLLQARESAIAFWTALAGDPAKLAMLGLTAQQVQNMVVSLQNANVAASNFGTKFLMTAEQINQSLANGLAGAFDKFAQAVANGENAFESARDAFLAFASDFLRQIAQMIMKQAILNMLGAGADGGGGIGGSIASAIGKLFHDGGIVGQGGDSRTVSPAWFANAARYHTGGIVGLKPNEVPAVLEKNEEVLTTADPRHSFNGGGAGGGAAPQDIKIVNTIDSGDFVSQGLNTRVGQRAILNFIRENPGAVKQAMGS